MNILPFAPWLLGLFAPVLLLPLVATAVLLSGRVKSFLGFYLKTENLMGCPRWFYFYLAGLLGFLAFSELIYEMFQPAGAASALSTFVSVVVLYVVYLLVKKAQRA
ncbi:MAG: hypothetical protein A3J67_05615 [Parcubacteria group bacterium RIFCSPHIGHO2_02_FULL_48_10b]|nr:MAG: hypothetical protein A3J67_05615 [Parcubacteria group bacterium RIFCSPHIGHO2_02_FULL_48_10b]